MVDSKKIHEQDEESRNCLDPIVTPTLFFVIKNIIGSLIAYFTVEIYKKFKK
jgi:hypothetical protein